MYVAASFLCLLWASKIAYSQIDLSRIFNRVTQTGITEKEAGQGLREALAQGVATAVLNLHRTDGFYGNDFYKLLLPPDSRKVESTLRTVGLGRQVDKAILAMNRGAEDAVGYATPIFTDAIKEMTLTDALGIVRGNKRSATDYFQQKTTQKLIAAFTPSVKASLDKTNATKYYSDLVTGYNRLPIATEKVNPDLTSYVVGKAVEALFEEVAKEEANIRSNPLARTSEILKKVFGGGK
jgi:hypothetical protein